MTAREQVVAPLKYLVANASLTPALRGMQTSNSLRAAAVPSANRLVYTLVAEEVFGLMPAVVWLPLALMWAAMIGEQWIWAVSALVVQ